MGLLLRGTALIPGRAEGELLVSPEPLSFWGGYDHREGRIIDRRHPLAGRVAAGRVLALPHTRGSSTTTTVLLEALRAGTAPAAILTASRDGFLALAGIVAQEMYGRALPVVVLEREDFDRLESGRRAEVRPDGTVVVS